MIIIEAGSIIKVEQKIFGLVPISPSHPSNRCKLTKQEALTLERKFFIAEIETCSDMMYRVAWSILRNDADVQDALQDAALKAWEKRDKLRDENFFRTWITRILINACYDTQRKRRRMRTKFVRCWLRMNLPWTFAWMNGRRHGTMSMAFLTSCWMDSLLSQALCLSIA